MKQFTSKTYRWIIFQSFRLLLYALKKRLDLAKPISINFSALDGQGKEGVKSCAKPGRDE
jgi:hypothetical protein